MAGSAWHWGAPAGLDGPSRGEGPPTSTCCQCFPCCSPGCTWPPLPQGHFSGSKSVNLASTVSPGVCTAAFQLGVPQHLLVQGLVRPCPGLQDFALPLVELHEVPVSPFLQPVKIPLIDSRTLRRVSLSSRLCATSCQLPEGPLCPISQTRECEQVRCGAAQGGRHALW